MGTPWEGGVWKLDMAARSETEAASAGSLGPLPIYALSLSLYYRHLGLINAPPYFVIFPPNDLFHYLFTIKKARNIQRFGQDLINPAGDTSCSSWGSSWGSSIVSQNETPKQVISCTYKVLIKRNTF